MHAYLEVAGFAIASPIEPHLRGPVEVSRCRHTSIRHLQRGLFYFFVYRQEGGMECSSGEAYQHVPRWMAILVMMTYCTYSDVSSQGEFLSDTHRKHHA